MVPEESMKGCINASNNENIIIIHLVYFALWRRTTEHRTTFHSSWFVDVKFLCVKSDVPTFLFANVK